MIRPGRTGARDVDGRRRPRRIYVPSQSSSRIEMVELEEQISHGRKSRKGSRLRLICRERSMVWFGNQGGFFELYHSWLVTVNGLSCCLYCLGRAGHHIYSRTQPGAVDIARQQKEEFTVSGKEWEDVPSPTCYFVHQAKPPNGNGSAKRYNVSRMRGMQAKLEDPAVDAACL